MPKPAQVHAPVFTLSDVPSARWVLLALFVAFFLTPELSLHGAPQARSVLVITSYHQGDRWDDNVIQGVTNVLGNLNQVGLSIEHLDMRRNVSVEHKRVMTDFLRAKYRNNPQDILIVSDDPALETVFEIRSEVFPNTPVVFCGINNFTPETLKGQTNITGVNEAVSIASTLDLALQLFPKTTRIMVQVSDKEANSRTHLEHFRTVARQFKGRVELVELLNLTTLDAPEALNRLPKDSLVLRLINILKPEGGFVSLQESMHILSRHSPVPVFTAWDFDVGEGALGGYVTSGFEQGRKAGELAAMILGGQSVDQIPVVMKSPNIPMFDFRQMQRFGLPVTALPAGTVITNKPFSIYEQYKPQIWVGIAVMALLCTLVLFLVAAILRRKAVEERLRESEQRFRTIYDSVSDAIFVHDAKDGRILDVNHRTCQMFGYTREEIITMDVGRLSSGVPPYTQQEAETRVRRALQGPVSSFEWQAKAKDGRIFWMLVSMSTAEFGGKERVLVSAQDISVRKDAEEALNTSREQLRQVIDLVPHFIFAKDLEGRFVLANQAVAEAYGTTVESLTGKTDADFASGESVRGFLECALTVSASGSRQVIPDERFSDAAGNVRHLSSVRVPFTFSGTDSPVVLGVSVDTTEHMKMQEVLVQTEKMLSVGGLAAGMAHEINNPLSGIIQSAQVTLSRLNSDSPANRNAALESGCTLESLRAFFEKRGLRAMVEAMRESAIRAGKIVNSMLEFSRSESNAMALANINTLLDKSLELCATDYDMKKKYDFKNIRIVKEYDLDLPMVECSDTQIQQVFMNVLTNAAQAMEHCSDPRIVLRTSSHAGFVAIDIEDNGQGMTDDVRKRVFEPFFTTKEVGKGTGLGLSVSYFIVVNHHSGTIEVESTPGKGSRFEITLPLVQHMKSERGTIRNAR